MNETLERLSSLVGQEINLFDKNGGPLDGNGQFITDWWNISNTFKLLKVFGKYFYIQSNSGSITKIRTYLVEEIQDKDIQLSIK